jgi:hypothetical protein
MARVQLVLLAKSFFRICRLLPKDKGLGLRLRQLIMAKMLAPTSFITLSIVVVLIEQSVCSFTRKLFASGLSNLSLCSLSKFETLFPLCYAMTACI